MSRPLDDTAPVVGPITADVRNAYAIRKGRPPIGRRVQLYRIAGWWRVWSAGPRPSTVWLLPDDGAAQDVADRLKGRGDLCADVVTDVAAGSIAVRYRDVAGETRML